MGAFVVRRWHFAAAAIGFIQFGARVFPQGARSLGFFAKRSRQSEADAGYSTSGVPLAAGA
jgi:hypothetical protein